MTFSITYILVAWAVMSFPTALLIASAIKCGRGEEGRNETPETSQVIFSA